MSLIPHVLDEIYRPPSIFDQNFGLGLLNHDLLQPHSLMYYRPWRHRSARHSGVSNVHYNKDGFKVNLDVHQFKPEEVTVKTVGNSVVVEAKHEERPDEHGYISRQFQRRYSLPDDVDPDAVTSKLSSDGILLIEAPKKALLTPHGERVVPITHTNAPAVKQVLMPEKIAQTSQENVS
ncbi:alpha-crystallin A chain [Anabrus simplex]|uniref:alpha-crystallin A chain n=1 Tax=Anabrus simplex TaxID=316456 RepID=UPI0034DCD55F